MVYPLRNLLISFAIIIIVVLLIVLRTFSTLRSQEKEEEKIVQSREALQKLGPAIIDMQEFESIAVDYFASSDKKFLNEMITISGRLKQDSAAMAMLASLDKTDRSSFADLADIIHAMTTLASPGLPVQQWQEGMIPIDHHIPIVTKFKRTAAMLEAKNREILNDSYSQSISFTRYTFSFVRIISVLILLILIISFYFIYHDIQTRKGTEGQLKQFNAELEKQVTGKTAVISESEKKYRSLFESLQLTEKNLRHVLSSTSEHFYVVDKNYRVTLINEAAEKNLKKAWGAPVIAGTNIRDLIPKEENEPIRASLDKVFNGQKVEYELNLSLEDLPPWVLVTYTPVADETGTIIGAFIFTKDITKRKKAEEAIKKSEERYRILVENAPEALVVFDMSDQKFVSVSESAVKLFKMSKEQLLETGPVALSPQYQRDGRLSSDIVTEKLNMAIHGEKPVFEWTHRDAEGNMIPCEVWLVRLPAENQVLIRGSIIDISERKKAEQEKEHVRYLLNERVKELTTLYQVSQIFQTKERSVAAIIHEIVSILPSGWQYPGITAARIVLGDTEFKTPNFGNAFHKQTATFPGPEGQQGRIEIIYLEQRPAESEDAFLAEERNLINMIGEMLRIYLARQHEAEMNKKMQQEILNQKIQDQKTVTRAILNAEERERNKIGRELHDNVNQILASIKLFLKMAAEKNGNGGKDLLDRSVSLVDNAIEEIRSLSKSQVTPVKKIDLKELIQVLVDRLDDSTSIKTTFVYKKDKLVDDDLKLNIYRIVQEQINNILKYAEATEIKISVDTDMHLLNVEVADNGKGFDPETKRKGIGISNMINRVESFNGELNIISSPGNGCKIDIRIPC